MRIASMFARRGFNIESLAVGPTERQDVSRITLRVDCEQHPLEQIEKQMHKLVNVLRVSELEPDEAVERELALLKVAAPAARRGELISLAQAFNARVADLGADAIVFEIVGHPEEIDSFEELVRPHGLKELVRTGRIGLGRASNGRRTIVPSTSSANRPKEKRMATIHREGNLDLLTGKVAVVGYGSQGHAHALNLHDSGVDGRRSACAREARRVPPPRRRASPSAPSPKPCAARRSSRCCSPTRCSRACTRRTSRRASIPTPRSSSRTASTSTTGASRRPRGTT